MALQRPTDVPAFIHDYVLKCISICYLIIKISEKSKRIVIAVVRVNLKTKRSNKKFSKSSRKRKRKVKVMRKRLAGKESVLKSLESITQKRLSLPKSLKRVRMLRQKSEL
jgi:hypothetical protein